MKVKCIINPREFNITTDKEYEVKGEKDWGYLIDNDESEEHWYSKNFFEMIKPELKITYEGGDEGAIIINNNKLKVHTTFRGTNISCGVLQFYGLNNIAETLIYNTNFEFNVCVDIMKKFIRNRVKEGSFRFMVCSTNLSGNYNNRGIRAKELFLKAFGEGIQGYNPNSDNDIAVWVIDKDEILNW